MCNTDINIGNNKSNASVDIENIFLVKSLEEMGEKEVQNQKKRQDFLEVYYFIILTNMIKSQDAFITPFVDTIKKSIFFKVLTFLL